MKRLFFLSAVAFNVAIHAETTDTLTLSLQDVQVVSTRASKSTPVAYTTMNAEQLRTLNHGQDVPYLLSLTPSVTMTSDAGNGIGYTTLRIRGTDGTRINVTANGIPMNDAESANLFWVNMGDFASSLQSIQIQRGVGTSTNGAGAFGATVNMQTENLGTEPFAGVDLSGGSYYSHKETVRFGTGLLDGHWALQGRLSNIGSKGYLDRASTKLNSYLLQAGWFGESTVVKFITWNGEEETYHAWDYTSKYEQSLYGRTYNSCGAMAWDDDYNPTAYYSNQIDKYHQQNYQLLLNQRLSRELTLNAALHYTRGDGHYEQFKDGRKWADYGMFEADAADVRTDADGLQYKPIVKGDLVRRKGLSNDFYGAVASLLYNNRKNLETAIGGGWNKYDGDHFGHVVWAGTPYLYYYNKANDKKLKQDGSTVYADVYGTTVTPDYEYYHNNAKKTDFNVYAKANYTFWHGLGAFLDLQYRHIGYRLQDPGDWYGANMTGEYIVNDNFNFFNPKLGLNYDIDRHHRVYASYAIAHKEPTRDNYQDNQGLPLRAERLNDLEVGYKFRSRTFSAGANVYWMDYKDQFVLTGELNDIGQAVAINIPKSYRLGMEIEAAWQILPSPGEGSGVGLRWDGNATFSKNRVKDALVTLDDYATNASLGDTPLSFSPDVIVNNMLTLSHKGLRASISGQYVGKQYLTNTGIECMTGWDAEGNETCETMMLDSHFQANADLSYTFNVPCSMFNVQSITAGVTLYNIFSAKFDNNGWAAPAYARNADGTVYAYNPNYASDYALRDQWAAGFAPSAPFNLMAHLSVNF